LRARLRFVVCQFVYLVALPPVLPEKHPNVFTEIFSLRFMACLNDKLTGSVGLKRDRK